MEESLIAETTEGKTRMYLKKAVIKNFRLLADVTLDLDESLTLFVGKNNTGKTSFMDLLHKLSDDKHKADFNDIPVSTRAALYQAIERFLTSTREDADYEVLKQTLCLPEVQLTVDYSKKGDNDNLGALVPFVIDIDEDTTEAVAVAKYELVTKDTLLKIYADAYSIFDNAPASVTDTDKKRFSDMVKRITVDSFGDICQPKFYAAYPKDVSVSMADVDAKEFRALFPIHRIMAERAMDESNQKNDAPLKKLFTSLFADKIENADIEDEIKQLKRLCIDAKLDTQKEIDKVLADIMQKAFYFGYPASEKQDLAAVADVTIDEPIKNADLAYVTEGGERLPSTRNGLGYKNLIKMELEMYGFALSMKTEVKEAVPLLFIEEPEAHMHPQLQQRFIEHIKGFTSKLLDGGNVQIVISTHSSHIASSASPDVIRYLHKTDRNVECKSLQNFSATNKDNIDFVWKYMTLTRCDLFFADKVILVEGASERLLLPNMIQTMFEEELRAYKPCLASQYYTVCEVGGAYAHRFIPFVKFLDIPTLILTDIDSVKEVTKKVNKNKKTNVKEEVQYKRWSSCAVSEATGTSNATIKYWMKKVLGKDDKDFDAIKNLSCEERTSGNIHIEWQTEEKGYCGRSLEDAIKNVNQEHYNLKRNKKGYSALKYDPNTDGNKTDFALKLLMESESYSTPEYIKRGLRWLSSCGEKEKGNE